MLSFYSMADSSHARPSDLEKFMHRNLSPEWISFLYESVMFQWQGHGLFNTGATQSLPYHGFVIPRLTDPVAYNNVQRGKRRGACKIVCICGALPRILIPVGTYPSQPFSTSEMRTNAKRGCNSYGPNGLIASFNRFRLQ